MRVTSKLEITDYIVCSMCQEEFCANLCQDEPPPIASFDYASVGVGFTHYGLQIWCVRHNVNVANFDFEGKTIPVNTNAEMTILNIE